MSIVLNEALCIELFGDFFFSIQDKYCLSSVIVYCFNCEFLEFIISLHRYISYS